MKKTIICLLAVVVVLVVVSFKLLVSQTGGDIIPIQNMENGMRQFNSDLWGGTTIWIVIDPTTLVAPEANILTKYVVPKTTKDAGYNFAVDIGTTTIYAVWHGQITLK